MTKEQIIREYYGGWEKSNWGDIERHLADDFTFTCPYDDHTDMAEYKERCWPGADSINKFEFLTIIENGDEAFARWNSLMGGKTVKNTEYFLFDGDKIKAVEVYFGSPAK